MTHHPGGWHKHPEMQRCLNVHLLCPKIQRLSAHPAALARYCFRVPGPGKALLLFCHRSRYPVVRCSSGARMQGSIATDSWFRPPYEPGAA